MTAPAAAGHLNTYTKVDVETTSQGKLIVMLFNGAIKRSEEARRMLQQGKHDSAHNSLVRAQDIVAELRSALNMSAGDVARNLDRLYEYFQHLLVTANIKKNPAPITECIGLMTELRDSWQELFEQLDKQGAPAPRPPQNRHGASLLNLQG